MNTKIPPLPHQLLGIYLWVNVSYNGSRTTRVPIPKVPINGKNNTRMEKTLKTNVEWALWGD
jgi:hypothetical protein